MGFSRNMLHRGHFKLKFITASAVIVMGVVLLTALFNRTSLEKLHFDAYLSEFSIDAALLAGDLGRLADSLVKEEGAAIEALLQRHRDRIDHRLKNGPDAISGPHGIDDALLAVSLVSPNGLILNSSDPDRRKTRIPLSVLNYLQKVRPDEKPGEHVPAGHVIEEKTAYLGWPLVTPLAAGGTYGMISFDRDMVAMTLSNSLAGERQFFWIVFSASMLLMIAVLCVVMPVRCPTPRIEQKKSYTTVTWFCIASQVVFSVLFAAGYRSQLLDLVQKDAAGARAELIYRMAPHVYSENAAAPGKIAPEKAIPEKAIKDAAERVISERPGIVGISITIDSIPTRQTIVAREFVPGTTASDIFRFLYDANRLVAHSQWAVPGVGSGEIRVFPSTRFLNHMLSEMVMDGITVLVISILLFMEAMFLMKASFGRELDSKHRKSTPVNYILMRPAAFLFLFAIDLSMSFIPLYMERLYEPMLGLSKDVVLGLPITIEFIFVGLAIFGSGYWVDRRGWHEPFIAGLLFSALGVLYSWLAPDAVNFILSRGLVGVGYGLSIMASQGFVITFTDLRSKALGLAQLFAGIYAGSICGGAAGAMLADRFGFSFTFQIGAVIILGIIAYTFAFMRHAMHKPLPPASPAASPAMKPEKVRFSEFIRNRIVISLILLSSLPASIAIVGFLNYFCPLYLNGLGVTQSSIGRILMVYGISLVYFGPIIGKYTDLSDDKRLFVFAGCILGSLTFLIFYFIQGIFAAILALLLLGLSSCFVLSSQSAYLLSLQVTHSFGQGKAVGIFRSTSRLGQALGPIVFSGLILAQNLENGIIFFGLIYLLTALLFFLFTQRDGRHFIEETA